MTTLSIFLLGIGAATFAASGLFFVKFWRASRDRFFLYFALAFWLLAIERVLHGFIQGSQDALFTPAVEASSWIYLVRLAAFVLILIATMDRNRSAKS